MAKITAYGEREIRRWRVGSRTLVLTQKKDGSPGRLLSKIDGLTGYNVLAPGVSIERAERYIDSLLAKPVSTANGERGRPRRAS